MPNTYTTQDGKTARQIVPTADGIGRYVNPEIVYPLTPERPDLIGKEFQGELVWQIETTKKWSAITDLEYEAYKNTNAVLRQALQALSVPVKPEEKLPYVKYRSGEDQPKLSVEEAANKYAHFETDNLSIGWDKEFVGREQGFIAGHTHATNDANLVPLDKVVDVLRNLKGRNEPYRLLVFDELIKEIITQIKNLTKE